ncbi:hypothetical protein SSX86_005146 [Deinandra increscens subsp. villosa]|uniref:AP2/ERF domain-containing protein n=1 Tax=Deinandra increscens subsp. villosa TaxID=3103831 RepID=A0AAP0H9R8_9ASTR
MDNQDFKNNQTLFPVVLEGEEFSKSKILARDSSVGQSSRIYYQNTTNEGVPFKWEMQPGTPLNPPLVEVIPPPTPPPAVQSLALPLPKVVDSTGGSKNLLSWRFWSWKRLSKKLRLQAYNKNATNYSDGDSDAEFVGWDFHDSRSSSFSSSSSLGSHTERFARGPFVCNHHTTRTTTSHHGLSIFPDGGCGSAGSAHYFSVDTASVYEDSELKTIATSLFCGFPNNKKCQKTEVGLTPPMKDSSPAEKGNVDNFGQRSSIYRGVTRHHQHGRWQARIGRVAGNKDLYLGTFSTQEAAAEAYDIAAIKFQGLNAVTNFDMSRYDVNMIAKKNLPIGGTCSKSKTNQSPPHGPYPVSTSEQLTESNILSFALPKKQDPSTVYRDLVSGYNQIYQSTTNSGNYNGGGFIQQDNNNGDTDALSKTSTMPMGTSIGLNGSSYGNWIEQSLHS